MQFIMGWECDSCCKINHAQSDIWRCPGCKKETCEYCFDRLMHCKTCSESGDAMALATAADKMYGTDYVEEEEAGLCINCGKAIDDHFPTSSEEGFVCPGGKLTRFKLGA